MVQKGLLDSRAERLASRESALKDTTSGILGFLERGQ